MKKLIMTVVLLFPAALAAKDYQGPNQADMQNMMQQMQKMQECMQDIDQSELDQLAKRSEQVSSQIEELCAAGKKAKALKTAVAFAKEAAKSSALQQMQKCGEMAQGGAIPGMPDTFDQEDYSENTICDGQ